MAFGFAVTPQFSSGILRIKVVLPRAASCLDRSHGGCSGGMDSSLLRRSITTAMARSPARNSTALASGRTATPTESPDVGEIMPAREFGIVAIGVHANGEECGAPMNQNGVTLLAMVVRSHSSIGLRVASPGVLIPKAANCGLSLHNGACSGCATIKQAVPHDNFSYI